MAKSVSLVVAVLFMHSCLGATDTCQENGNDICVSDECLTTSNYILSMMDRAADPCRNMYQYSCGAFQRRAHIPEDRTRWGAISVTGEENIFKIRKLIESTSNTLNGVQSSAIKKVKDYFQSCMDTTTIEMRGRTPFIELIDKLGSWTVTTKYNTNWNSAGWDIQTAMERVLSVTGIVASAPFFKFGVTFDLDNTTNSILNLYPSGLTLRSSRTYYQFKKYYLDAVSKVAVFLGGDTVTSVQKIGEIYKFEEQLAHAQIPTSAPKPFPRTNFNKMTISQAQALLGSWLDLKKYLQSAFVGKTITDNTIIDVASPSYLQNLNKLVQATSKELLNNYIVYRVFYNTLVLGKNPTTALPAKIQEAVFSATKLLYRQAKLPPRWEQCLSESENIMGFASSALFDEKHFTPNLKSKVLNMCGAIRQEIYDDMDQVTWLDNTTRVNLKEKAQAFKFMIGYPDWTTKASTLDAYYQDYQVTAGKAYENLLNAYKSSLRKTVAKFGKPADKSGWGMRPDIVNAWYSPVINQLTIPSGYLQWPLYSPLYPDAYNYGSLVSTIGHEASHGFDNKGRLFDKDGYLRDIWTSTAVQGFNKATQCLVDQYNNFQFQNTHLNGKLELGENIADNGGLKLAYRAMKRATLVPNKLPGLNFTTEQLFFIGFGQKFCSEYRAQYELSMIATNAHPPSNFRLLGSIANSKEFGKAFNCPVGSPMNPAHKCEVW